MFEIFCALALIASAIVATHRLGEALLGALDKRQQAALAWASGTLTIVGTLVLVGDWVLKSFTGLADYSLGTLGSWALVQALVGGLGMIMVMGAIDKQAEG